MLEAFGQVLMQDQSAAAFTAKVIDAMPNPKAAEHAREPSFASWTKPDFTECQPVPNSTDIIVPYSGSPTKRAKRGSVAVPC